MILTLTINPAIDRTVTVDRLVFEDRGYILSRSEAAGGRGINASHVISAFGGKKLNSYRVWLPFCAIFLLGLVDWRRPLSLRTLDLVALLSFSVSLWFFNRGNIFASAPLAYPPLVYLIGRGLWIGLTGRATPGRTVWPPSPGCGR